MNGSLNWIIGSLAAAVLIFGFLKFRFFFLRVMSRVCVFFGVGIQKGSPSVRGRLLRRPVLLGLFVLAFFCRVLWYARRLLPRPVWRGFCARRLLRRPVLLVLFVLAFRSPPSSAAGCLYRRGPRDAAGFAFFSLRVHMCTKKRHFGGIGASRQKDPKKGESGRNRLRKRGQPPGGVSVRALGGPDAWAEVKSGGDVKPRRGVGT